MERFVKKYPRVVLHFEEVASASAIRNFPELRDRKYEDLENTMGVRLLDRSPKGIEATQYGRALLKRSIAVSFLSIASARWESQPHGYGPAHRRSLVRAPGVTVALPLMSIAFYVSR
jgi:hypothetical protein